MTISAFDLYKVGIGPSSSHTVGPMRAANTFVTRLATDGLLARTTAVRAEMFGSLGVTGHGHGTVKAVVLGLEGEQPDLVDPEVAEPRVAQVRAEGVLQLAGKHAVKFSMDDDLVLHRRKRLPFHSNGMRFIAPRRGRARPAEPGVLLGRRRVRPRRGRDRALRRDRGRPGAAGPVPVQQRRRAAERTRETGLSISELMLANELTRRSEGEIRAGLLHIWSVMQECVDRGARATGILPGGLNVRRRAGALRTTLEATEDSRDPLRAMEWITLYALAVNEENAAGGRVVTAPTNGAAGIVPAVLHYYRDFVDSYSEDGVVRFLLDRGCGRDPVQGERLHLRRGGGLPGRGRVGVLHGGRRTGGGPRRDARTRSRTRRRSASSTTSD